MNKLSNTNNFINILGFSFSSQSNPFMHCVYRAYSKLYENKLEDGSIVGSIDDSSELNESGYKLTGNSFAVNGANTITLHGTTYVAPKDDDDDDDY